MADIIPKKDENGSWVYPANAITPDQFKPATPITLPEIPPPTPAPTLSNYAQQYYDTLNAQPGEAETTAANLSTTLTDLLGETAGKAQTLAQEQDKLGLAQKKEAYNKILSQTKEKITAYDKLSADLEADTAKNAFGTNVRASVVFGQQGAIARQKAAEISMLNSQAATLAGDYNMALEQAQQAVDLKYAPIEEQIAIKKAQLEAIKPMLDAEQKKKYEAAAYAIRQQEIDAQNKKQAEQEMYNRKIKSEEIARDQFNADRSFEQAKLQADRQFEQNQKEFGAQYALQVRATNLAEAKYKNDLVQQDIKNRQDAIKTATDMTSPTDTTKFTDKIKQIEEISKSSGLAGAVGPNFLARDFGLGSLTGEKQAFIGNVQNLISADVLQTLVNLKKSGGTLGAVSEKELSLLQAASSRIGEWAKTDEQGKVLYYDVSEKEFKKELDRIKESTQRVVDAIEEQAFVEYLKIQQ